MNKFGKFVLKEMIGEGGYAHVFLAVGDDGRKVALKILKESMKDRPNVLHDFCREARIHERLKHKNIVRCLGLKQQDKRFAIVTEYFESETLKMMVSKCRDLNEKMTLMLQIGLAISYLHRKGYVHMDLKPGNVLVNKKLEVKLIDFCLTFKDNFISRFYRKFVQRSIPGSPAYMAPEVIRGEVPDKSADLYSLGVISYFVFTGVLPFSGSSTAEILKMQEKAIPIAPRTLNPDIPEELEVLIFRLLVKERENRLNDIDFFCKKILEISQKIGRDAVICNPLDSKCLV